MGLELFIERLTQGRVLLREHEIISNEDVAHLMLTPCMSLTLKEISLYT